MCRLALVAFLVSIATGARAQDTDAAEALFREGVAALQEGRLPEARTALRASLELNPHPSTAFNLMTTLTDLDELIAASSLCRQLLEDDFGDLGERRVQVERLCEEVWEQTPIVDVVARGAPAIDLRIDGEADSVLEDGAQTTRRLDPGRHVLRVEAPGHRGDEYAVDLARSDRTRIELRVVTDAEAKKRRLVMAGLIAGGILLAGGVIAIAVAASRPASLPRADASAETLSDSALFRF